MTLVYHTTFIYVTYFQIYYFSAMLSLDHGLTQYIWVEVLYIMIF